ncbi:MAG: peptide synthase, partial [Deltaproteobacteria bacterium]|nr:peptide synthase [Deltaproteobacteria bacterium]
RIWFCGRKSHRVVTKSGALFTIPCEAIFNNHPDVFRSALVGVNSVSKEKSEQIPVICIEVEGGGKCKDEEKLEEELFELAKTNVMTENIEIILFHKSFPVDIRHNSKIFREKLTLWAEKQLKAY